MKDDSNDDLFVRRHLVESLLAALAEAQGFDEIAKHKRAQARLRLCTMSHDQLWLFAEYISTEDKSPNDTFVDIGLQKSESINTADNWLRDLFPRKTYPIN